MRVWKQCTEEHRTTRKTGSGRRKVTSAGDDRHLLRMAVNYRTASSRQFEERFPSRQNIYGCVCNGLMSTEADKLFDTKLSFSVESRFNLLDQDDRIHARRYAGGRCLSDCVIEQQSDITSGVMIWGAT
ncbi:transposable element Tcb2 transposase [Trichonephila clavipes]|uniref:Transposable element Tcb2 transposase n=1 Tax=Trichonephila clavipes TaxID=2585209 RepID=A0A8X6RPJ1_TRICX|nr:transposable element Tcb2 transposase [Trichonephila clavipes]